MSTDKRPMEDRGRLGPSMKEGYKRKGFLLSLARQGYGKSLYKLMESKGVSCDELAKRIGESPEYVNGAIEGSTDISLEGMALLALGLEAQLYTQVGEREKTVLLVESGGS